jgi:hypothetical protein
MQHQSIKLIFAKTVCHIKVRLYPGMKLVFLAIFSTFQIVTQAMAALIFAVLSPV